MTNHFVFDFVFDFLQTIVTHFGYKQMIIQNEFFSFVSHLKPLGKGFVRKYGLIYEKFNEIAFL